MGWAPWKFYDNLLSSFFFLDYQSSEAVTFDLEFNSDHSENEDSANVTVILQ
jgi:hypothetical protein